MSSNIEKFDLLVAELLATLYERFPVTAGITASDRGINAENMFRGDGTIDQDIAAALEFFCNTVRWLKRAGYIDYDRELDSGTFSELVLTAKALEILKATPSSLTGKQTLGSYLVDSARNGATEALKQGVTTALSAGVSLAWAAVKTQIGHS